MTPRVLVEVPFERLEEVRLLLDSRPATGYSIGEVTTPRLSFHVNWPSSAQPGQWVLVRVGRAFEPVRLKPRCWVMRTRGEPAQCTREAGHSNRHRYQ